MKNKIEFKTVKVVIIPQYDQGLYMEFDGHGDLIGLNYWHGTSEFENHVSGRITEEERIRDEENMKMIEKEYWKNDQWLLEQFNNLRGCIVGHELEDVIVNFLSILSWHEFTPEKK